MRRNECPREADLLDALQTTAWPDACGQDLRTHVRECHFCEELAAIVLPLLDEHRTATREARVPSSAIVWWKSQRRARLEAAMAAARPIAIWQYLCAACAVGLMAGALGYVSPAVRTALASAWSMLSGTAASGISPLAGGAWQEVLVTPVGIAVAAGLTMAVILAPLALYLANDE